jgi:hypothetical protein
MTSVTRIAMALALAGVPLASGPAWAGLRFKGPVLSRDSALVCAGARTKDEVRLSRLPEFGLTTVENGDNSTIDVLCPVNRRQTAAYFEQHRDDHVKWNKITIWGFSNSTVGSVSCKAYVYDFVKNTTLESAPRFLCATDGGCPTAPAPGNFGFKSIVIDTGPPFVQTDGELLVNFGVRCSLPALPSNQGGTIPVRLIGSEGEFESESTGTLPLILGWQENKSFQLNELTVFDNLLYQARQAHTAVAGWEPPNVPSLWQRPAPVGMGDWAVQTAYQVGNRVLYTGKVYRCLQAHNSQSDWAPNVVPALWKAE